MHFVCAARYLPADMSVRVCVSLLGKRVRCDNPLLMHSCVYYVCIFHCALAHSPCIQINCQRYISQRIISQFECPQRANKHTQATIGATISLIAYRVRANEYHIHVKLSVIPHHLLSMMTVGSCRSRARPFVCGTQNHGPIVLVFSEI